MTDLLASITVPDETSPRLAFTVAAIELANHLWDLHGPLMFHQSGGCCDGSAPMCYQAGDFKVGGSDVLLGQIDLRGRVDLAGGVLGSECSSCDALSEREAASSEADTGHGRGDVVCSCKAQDHEQTRIVPLYMSAEQFTYWRHTFLTIDVVPGRGSGFSLEAPEGKRFLTRSRLLK